MAIVCPLCPQDACCHFIPKSPDPYIKKDADMTPAKFGHLNHLIDMLCCISDTVAGLVAGTVQSIVYCGSALPEIAGVVTIPAIAVDGITITGTGCIGDPLVAAGPPITDIVDCSGNVLIPVLGVVTLPGVNVELASPTQALTGDGCEIPLSVCIDGTTITKDINGCLQAVATPTSLEFAAFFGMTAGGGNTGVDDYAATFANAAAGEVASVAAGSGINFPRLQAPVVGGIIINDPGAAQTDNTEFLIPEIGRASCRERV